MTLDDQIEIYQTSRRSNSHRNGFLAPPSKHKPSTMHPSAHPPVTRADLFAPD